MKTTTEKARETLVINGSLLDAILEGGIIVSYKFTGWDWYVLVKHPKDKWKATQDRQFGNRLFQYTQFQTLSSINSPDFYEAIHRNGTPKQVLGKFNKDFYEEKFGKELALALGNIT